MKQTIWCHSSIPHGVFLAALRMPLKPKGSRLVMVCPTGGNGTMGVWVREEKHTQTHGRPSDLHAVLSQPLDPPPAGVTAFCLKPTQMLPL